MVDCDALDSELLLLLEEDIWRSNKAILIATSPSSRYCYQWKLSCFSTGGGIEGLAQSIACSVPTYQRLENVLAAAVCSLACVYVFKQKN